MKIENLYMTVGEIIPKLHSKFSKNMNVHATPGRIMFYKIGKSGWKGRNVAETFE